MFARKRFEYSRIFLSICRIANPQEPKNEIDLYSFYTYLKSIEQMGYKFTDQQIIMIFRRFDKDCDGTISQRDFFSEFEAIEIID